MFWQTSTSTVQLVELKNGEAYNGKMDSCDTWMNIHLKEVICTSKDGESFWRMREVFIRGNTIKYIRVPDDTLGKAVEDKARKPGVHAAICYHRYSQLRPRYWKRRCMLPSCGMLSNILLMHKAAS